jgi:hypothetical protein
LWFQLLRRWRKMDQRFRTIKEREGEKEREREKQGLVKWLKW